MVPEVHEASHVCYYEYDGCHLKNGDGYRIFIMKLLSKKEHLITENVETYSLVYTHGQFNQRTKVNEWKIPTPNPRRITSDLNYNPTYTTDWMSDLAIDNSRHKLDLIIFVITPRQKSELLDHTTHFQSATVYVRAFFK